MPLKSMLSRRSKGRFSLSLPKSICLLIFFISGHHIFQRKLKPKRDMNKVLLEPMNILWVLTNISNGWLRKEFTPFSINSSPELLNYNG